MWKDLLCSGHNRLIILWKHFDQTTVKCEGHTNNVYCLAHTEEFLFSGSLDCTIRKWTQAGHCLQVIKQPFNSIKCLLVHNNQLYSASIDRATVLKRWTLDGHCLQEFKGQNGNVQAMSLWRGALFSAGWDAIVQWTDFYVWSKSTHQQFSLETRQAIKTVMLLESVGKLPCHVPMDLLTLIFEYCTATNQLQQGKVHPYHHRYVGVSMF